MSQFVEHEASNLRVAGSSPALGMDRHGYLAHGQRWHHDIIWELVVPILTAGCVWGEGGGGVMLPREWRLCVDVQFPSVGKVGD